MCTHVTILWAMARARWAAIGERNDVGSVVETVILTAVFAALAIAVGAVIVDKITTKANSIDLN